ncbi:MAG: sulfur carrier protein ThiS [Melioribacteraceae bacterium]|nr:sulfur carrier protein ThiS [Melioribacteraceae bacterium]
MKIVLNNREEVLETNLEEINVDKLLKIKKFSFTRLIVKINDRFIPKENYGTASIHPNDKVDVIHMISGG